eukprot:3080509-Pyramimonas_sp.AAC.1
MLEVTLPPSSLFIGPYNGSKILKRAKTLFLGFFCHVPTCLLRRKDPEPCQSAIVGTSTQRINIAAAPAQS